MISPNSTLSTMLMWSCNGRQSSFCANRKSDGMSDTQSMYFFSLWMSTFQFSCASKKQLWWYLSQPSLSHEYESESRISNFYVWLTSFSSTDIIWGHMSVAHLWRTTNTHKSLISSQHDLASLGDRQLYRMVYTPVNTAAGSESKQARTKHYAKTTSVKLRLWCWVLFRDYGRICKQVKVRDHRLNVWCDYDFYQFVVQEVASEQTASSYSRICASTFRFSIWSLSCHARSHVCLRSSVRKL